MDRDFRSRKMLALKWVTYDMGGIGGCVWINRKTMFRDALKRNARQIRETKKFLNSEFECMAI